MKLFVDMLGHQMLSTSVLVLQIFSFHVILRDFRRLDCPDYLARVEYLLRRRMVLNLPELSLETLVILLKVT